jgi:cytochrome c
LFDYIKRAMPFTTPNSMSNDDVYAVTAYILFKANIIPQDAAMDQDSLPKVTMPNRDNFKPADR